MKKGCFWVTWVLALGSFAASVSAETVTVTDMAGRRVTATLDPARIVCIGPGALRLIVYLGAGEKVVGVEDMEKMHPGGRPYWIAHPELQALPRCGSGGPAGIGKKPDMESVLSVRPEVIFATYMNGPLADEVQQIAGIPVVVLSYGTLRTFDEAVYDTLRIAGSVLNRKKRAEDVMTFIESLRKDLRRRTGDLPDERKPSVYVGGIGYRGAHGIESTEQRFIPFDWVGANNVADRVTARIGTHVLMDKETLLKLDPDIVFVDGGGTALVAEDYRRKPDFYHAMKAFARGRVYTLLPFNWYATNMGTALADAYAVGKILYGDRFGDVDPERKADEIYTFLVGRPVYEKMKKDYGAIGSAPAFLQP